MSNNNMKYSSKKDAKKKEDKKKDDKKNVSKQKNLKLDNSSDDGEDFLDSEGDDFDSEDIEDTEDSEYETFSEEEEEEEDSGASSGQTKEEEYFNKKKFQKTLVSLFPSDYTKKKYQDMDDSEEEEESDENRDRKHKKQKQLKNENKKTENKKPEKREKKEKDSKEKKEKHFKKGEKKKSKKHVSESEESNTEDDTEDSSSDFIAEDEEEEGMNANRLSLIFAMGGGGASEANASVIEEYERMLVDDKHETCNSEDEKTFMKEMYVSIEIPKEVNESISSESIDSRNKNDKKKKKHHHSHGKEDKNRKEKSSSRKHEEEEEEEEKKEKKSKKEDDYFEKKYMELVQLKKELSEQYHKKPNSKILKNAIQECRDSIAKLIKRTRNKNTKAYYKLVNGEEEEKQNNSELSYFKKKCSHKEQMKIMEDLREINSFSNVDKPYRLALLESNIPAKFKAVVMQKLKVLRTMEPGDSEYFKLKNWVDGFMRVPFGIYKNLNVNIHDGLDKCHEFIETAKATLDNCTYGLNDAKLQILQMVGQWIANPAAMGSSIAIHGPPGTGKTTIVKDGISKILGRDFAFIALGGAGDSSFLEGHSYTYEGSSWGKIIQILMDSKSMNPVIYFDELDKISDTPRGEEITNILVHLTDITQNDEYHDKYFSEVSFRLSQCLFIFSYNDESKVNPILKDRMYRIHTKGYDAKEKVIIARKHLLPKIREQVNFLESDVEIPDETLQYIISNAGLCKNEQGVRNLKRCLEIIHTKLNLFRLVKHDTKLFEKDINLGEVVFPFIVSKKHVDILIKNEEPLNHSMLAMYV